MRQKIKQHPFIATRIIVAIFVAIFIAFIIAAYKLGWDWTGFSKGESQTISISTSKGTTTAKVMQPAKALWDWLQLLAVLAIPVVVGIGGVLFTATQAEQSDAEKTDNQREAALHAYLDKMSELLLKEHLGELTADGKLNPEYKQVRNIARARTLTVLRQLDGSRKGNVIQFLSESRLTSGIIDLYGADLREAELYYTNLSKVVLYIGTDLTKSRMVCAHLDGANLSECNLGGVDLRGADLHDAYLSKSYLGGAKLSGIRPEGPPGTPRAYTNLSGAHLNGANLEKANLGGAKLRHADLSDAKLHSAYLGRDQKDNHFEVIPSGTTLDVTTLQGAILRKADLRKADLREANLSGANLERVDLRQADLSGADLSGANLKGAIGITEEMKKAAKSLVGAILPDGSMYLHSHGANLSGADLRNVNLEGVDLSGADLSGADLRNVNRSIDILSRADSWKVYLDLSEAKLKGAKLHGAFLRGAWLKGAKLEGAFLCGANLEGVDLSHANLSDADLSHANLSHADLSEACLVRARMDDLTQLTETTLKGAKFNTKPIQEKDAQGKPITIEPTRWPKKFDYKAAGVICVDCISLDSPNDPVSNPISKWTTIPAKATFTDPLSSNTHTVVWDWGDGKAPSTGAVTEPNDSNPGTVSDSHIYNSAGYYSMQITIKDKDSGTTTCQSENYVVVSDPNSHKTIKGLGHIKSPAGSEPSSPSTTGIAEFTDLNGKVIYDNQMGASDIIPPTQEIHDGNITIQEK